MNWWILLKIGTKGLFGSLNMNSRSKFEMADPICRPKIFKNPMSLRIWIQIGTRGLFGSLTTNLRLNIDIRYVFSEPKKALVPTLIEIRQFIRFFKILICHIGSVISKFPILSSNSYLATQITPWYQFLSKSANSLDFSKCLVAILDQPFRIFTPNSYSTTKITH